MFALFKDKLDHIHASYSKFKDKETAEAVVAIMTGTAYADGELEDAEKKKLIAAFRVNPVLKQFDTSVLLRKFNELSEQAEFDHEVGLDACIKEIRDVSVSADEEKRLAILRMGVAAAKADGEIEPAEVKFLQRAALQLGLQLSQVYQG